MPPRLRSKPYGPNSPNAAEGLPDPAPRRRRATRSASAQPQEDQPAPPARESKTRKTRGKAASRGKKKATRRTSPSPSPSRSSPASPQPGQLEGDATTSGAVAQGPSEKVESPNDEPHRVNVDEAAVEQLQAVLSEAQKADQSAAEQVRTELEMHIPASPSVEIPVTVLPSIESSDPQVTTSSTGVCESPTSFFSLRSSLRSSSVTFFSVRSSSVVSAASTPSDMSSTSTSTSTSTEVPGNQRRSWLMTKLRSMYRLYTRSQSAFVLPAAATTAPAVGWSLDVPVLNPNTAQSHSALDDLELISIIRAVRSAGTESNRRRPRASPSPSSSEQSRVLRAQEATPIHRSRTSYAKRSNSRRIESRGSLGRTLYRLPQLLSFHSEPEPQDGSGEENVPANEQDSHNLLPATVFPETTPPATPERLSPATPVAPMTAPPAGTDVSPGWSRWIFNGVSRRWTVLRGRLAHDHDHDHENENENQPVVATADEPAVSTAPASPAQPVLVSPDTIVEIAPAVVSGPVVAPNATSAPTSTLAFSPADRDQGMSPLIRGPSRSPPPRPVLPLPRSRRRTTSFVDTRTILAADDPTSDLRHETQHEFVKRRQAARAALTRQRAEARNREIMAAKRAAAAEAAAAQEAARSKLHASSNPPQETSASASGGSLSTSNTVNRAASIISRLIPRASHFQIAPAPRGNASEEAAVQTLAKSNVDAEKPNPRKRTRGFGLDEDDLAVHEEDFTPEEWEVLKAQVEKAEEDAAKAAQESAPPTKKRRVDQSSKQQKRTQPPVRRQTTPHRSQPPARTPGFVPNRRGTLAPPDLSPIDSSRLMTDHDSPSISQTPPASTQPLETNEVPRSTPQSRPKSRRGTPAQTQASLGTQTGTIINGVFVPKHQLPRYDTSTEEAWKRSLLNIPRRPTTAAERRAKRNKPSPFLTFFKSCQSREEPKRNEAAALKPEAEVATRNPQTPQRRVRWADLEPSYNQEMNTRWQDPRDDSGAPTTPASILRPAREPSQTSRMFEDAYLAAAPPASSPTLPTPPCPAIKRKRECEASGPDASSSAPDTSSSSRRPVKRSRGYEAPDPYASSSSPSSASSHSSPYDAATYYSSLQPQRHSPQDGEQYADVTYPHAAATDDLAAENEDPSPLSRARNKAEFFKPKTPSRLRESTRIPSSNASTPSALGFPSPSFLGVSMNNSPFLSDPMSIDGSSYLSNTDTAAVDTRAATTQSTNTPTRSLTEDVAWLSQASPNGDFAELPWPERRSLVEVLNIDPRAVPIAEKCWHENGAELVKYFEAQFEAFKAR